MQVAQTSLRSAAALSALGVAVAGAARFGYSVLVGRLDGTEALAAVNAGISLALLAGMLWPAATGAAASKFLAREAGTGGGADAAAGHLARRTMVTGGVLAVAASLAAVVVLDAGPGRAVVVGALTLASSAYLFVRGVQYGTFRVAQATSWEAVSAALALVLLAGVLLAGWDGALLVPLAVGYATYAVAGWPRGARGRPARAQRREMDAFVAWAVVGNLASAGLLQLSVVAAAVADTPHRAGLYAAAVSLATPASMLARALAQALFPAMARAAGRGDGALVRAQTDAATRGLVTLVVAVFGVLLLAARPLLRLVYGPGFVEGAVVLQVALAAVLLSTVSVPAVASLTSGTAGGIRTSAAMSSAGFATGAVVMALAAPGSGTTGIALGLLSGTAVTGALPWVLVWRRQHLAWGGLTVRVLGALAVLVLVALAQRGWQGQGALADAGAVLLALAFAAGWAVVCREDLRRLAEGVR